MSKSNSCLIVLDDAPNQTILAALNRLQWRAVNVIITTKEHAGWRNVSTAVLLLQKFSNEEAVNFVRHSICSCPLGAAKELATLFAHHPLALQQAM